MYSTQSVGKLCLQYQAKKEHLHSHSKRHIGYNLLITKKRKDHHFTDDQIRRCHKLATVASSIVKIRWPKSRAELGARISKQLGVNFDNLDEDKKKKWSYNAKNVHNELYDLVVEILELDEKESVELGFARIWTTLRTWVEDKIEINYYCKDEEFLNFLRTYQESDDYISYM